MSPDKAEKNRVTWQEAQMIRGKKIMGHHLCISLTQLPELTNELSNSVHGTDQSYAEIVRHYLNNLPLEQLAADPFIEAFRQTPQCTPEEKQFLENLPVGTATDFQDWLKTREDFIAAGLQYCVRSGIVITPLTREEARRKDQVAAKVWRETHPDEFKAIQQIAVQAAAQAAQPRVYTAIIRSEIQSLFNQGHNYKETAELLQKKGIELTYKDLRRAVSEYPDLTYTPKSMERKKHEDFLTAISEILRMSRSGIKTKLILTQLGFSKNQIKYAFVKLGHRDRINWNVTIPELDKSLKEFAEPFITGGHPSTKEEYQAFMRELEARGVSIVISETAYRTFKRDLLKKSQS